MRSLAAVIDAASQRPEKRPTHRYGYRDRTLTTTAAIWSCDAPAAGGVVLPVPARATTPRGAVPRAELQTLAIELTTTA
jgi:hypothetical protein